MCDLCGLDACLRRSENLVEFRIRGLQNGSYLRNISNENLGIEKVIRYTTTDYDYDYDYFIILVSSISRSNGSTYAL